MATNTQLKSRLFSIPSEIRDRIYDFYLSPNETDFSETLRPAYVYLERTEHRQPLPSLMLTCKRLYRELRPHVHEQAVLKVWRVSADGRRIGFAVHGTLRVARLRKLWLMVAMEHANWNAWLGFFVEVAARAIGLHTLAVDWQPRNGGRTGGTWQGRVYEKKEGELLRVISEMRQLRVVQLFGNAPVEWVRRLEEGGRRRVVRYPFRWWRDPGMDL